ncbi:hypothetical protein K439DRAFT_1625838 [Ramaria rubella]|nr:hypothetical protein K439DRAFT_1625838 [Ramaria rubella]
MSPSSNDAHHSPPPASPPLDSSRQLDKRDLPPPSSRPPPRPVNLRSSFDLEPNPFEQSFSNTRSSSSAESDSKSDDKHHTSDDQAQKSKPDSGTPKPVLPSLAALSSPSDGYTWSDLAGSLRSGPLSPAMLPGPQQPQQQQTASMPLGSYDPTRSFGRTGLTPSTGLTPLVGGPVSFPPPSPNTAAFLAMVTNTSSTSQMGSTPATITPNTLNAITGMMNPTQSQQSAAIAPSATTSSPNSGAITTAAPQQQPHHTLSVTHIPTQGYQYAQHHNGQQPNGYAPTSAANAANAAANGLFLLSQAHQELTKREEAQARAGQGAAGVDSQQQNRRGSKRKSIDGPPVSAAPSRAPTAKRPRANTRNGRRGKASTGSPEDDDDSVDEDEMRAAVEESERHSQANGNKKPETEEEKRKNFLERNRQAALKCRQRKKAWLAQLQAKVEFLTNENERLTSALVSSREEISRLSALLGAAGSQQPGVSAVGSQPVSVSVSLPSAAKSVQSQAPQGPPVSVVANGRGYGY